MPHSANATQPTVISKENITGLKFPHHDVLKSSEAIAARQMHLDRALKLGNNEKNKIKIIFEDSEGIKQVETTIWGVTDKRVILKQGTLLPISCIHEVKL